VRAWIWCHSACFTVTSRLATACRVSRPCTWWKAKMAGVWRGN